MNGSNDAGLNLFLDRLQTRSPLSPTERKAILALPAHPMRLRKRQDFVHINEETSHACLIVSGMVARFGQTNNGMRQITAFHIPGDMVDLQSAVRPIGAGGLSALCETTILKVPHAAIRALAARFPAIAEAFWRDCTLDSAILMEWVVNVGRRDARTRLAHILCEMAIRSGPDLQVQHEYAFPVTQEQLGDAAGLTPVHVNRSLKSLGDFATLRGGTVHIHDWAQLAHIGEFDDGYLVANTVPPRPRRQGTAASPGGAAEA